MDMQEWQKEAQVAVEKSAEGLGDLLHKGTDRLTEYWNSLGDDTKQSLTNAAIGAGLGGALAGGVGAANGGVEDGLAYSGIGAALGALAGGAGTTGFNMMTHGPTFDGERVDPTLVDAIADTSVSTALTNPGAAVGLGLGSTLAFNKRPTAAKLVKAMNEAQVAAGASAPSLSHLSAYNNARNIKYRTPINRNILRRASSKVMQLLGKGSQMPLSDLVNKNSRAMSNVLHTRNVTSPGNWKWALTVPALTGVGYLVDRYLRGDNG